MGNKTKTCKHKPKSRNSRGKGFFPDCAGGKEGTWHRDGQLHSPFIGDLDLEG